MFCDNDSCNFSWVVLDDDDSCVNDKRFKDLCAPHTVLTDSRLGLTDTDADLAIAVLLSDVGASSRGAQQQAPDEKKKKMRMMKKKRMMKRKSWEARTKGPARNP